MFPIFNDYDKIVGFGGRKLYEDDLGGKYINSPESKVYSKSRILYGLNFAKEKIRYYDFVILVEGYMDLIALHKSGFENVVASSGTALTEDQTRLLARYTKNVYILFDSDMAGIKAAKRGIEILLENGFDISVISLPSGEDPDSYIKNNGIKEFEKRISEKQSFINFIGEFYSNENKLNTVEEKTVFVKEMISYISKIPDNIKRPLFIKEISSRYKLSENLLTEEMNKIITSYRKAPFQGSSVVLPVKNEVKSESNGNHTDSFEFELIELFIHGNDEAIEYLESNIHTEYIKNKKILRITEVILDALINHGTLDIASVINELDEEEDKQLLTRVGNSEYEASVISKPGNDSLLNHTANPVYTIKNAKDIIRRFRIRELETKRMEIRSDPDRLIEIFEITKEINELTNKVK